MPTLLVVHHTVSPATRELLEAALAGVQLARDEGVDVTVEQRPALSASTSDVLAADGILLGTPVNIGYMSGALKYFFDMTYYPLLDATKALPYGLYLHGNDNPSGALRAITAITGALQWSAVAQPVVVNGMPTAAGREACTELGATLAATIGI